MKQVSFNGALCEPLSKQWEEVRPRKAQVVTSYEIVSGDTGILKQDYEATELSGAHGDEIKIYFQESGWCWAQNQAGLRGWIPSRNLKML